jgi:oligopeptide transport system ATP-binding protein
MIAVTDLSKHYAVPSRKGGRKHLRALDRVSFEIREREILGIVGESGCGKSTLGKAMLRLVEPTSGHVVYQGKDLTQLSSGELQALRTDLQMVFQDPYSSLNPRMRVGEVLGEVLWVHGTKGKEEQARRVSGLLDMVGLSQDHARRFPHEFSGGQRQRIGIARALAVSPKFLVLDEPVSSLDVSIQAQILSLLTDLKSRLSLTYLFISHDLAVISMLADRVAVMYLGRIVESGPVREVFSSPLHPYTQALISAIPTLSDEPIAKKAKALGEPANPVDPPPGCPYHPRCPLAQKECRIEVPELRTHHENHTVSCHLV